MNTCISLETITVFDLTPRYFVRNVQSFDFCLRDHTIDVMLHPLQYDFNLVINGVTFIQPSHAKSLSWGDTSLKSRK